MDGVTFRPWRVGDEASLVRYADNRKVWRNLRDRFPSPYTRQDAETWISVANDHDAPPTNFAIDLAGEAIGGVGVELQQDVARITGEVGYWLGEPFWGRGIATQAAQWMTTYAFATFPVLQRLQAVVFAWNAPSARVLEKAGYLYEGRLRQAVIKDGEVTDLLMYARLRERDH